MRLCTVGEGIGVTGGGGGGWWIRYYTIYCNMPV